MSGGKYLTKISYVNGMRCPRLLWLTARRPDAHPSFEEKIRMDDGEQVGNLAQQWHQDLYHKAANSNSAPKQLKKGFMPKFTKPTAPPTTPGVAVIQMDQGMGIAVEQTAAAIRNPEIQMIHEGTFFHNDVYCRIDLMHRASLADPSAPPTAWNILEVKSKTSLDSNRDHYLRDAAIQNWVVSRHISVHKTKLVYVNNTCIGPVHRGMLKTFFVEEDVSEEIKPWVTKMANDVERLKRVVRSEEEPQADIGNRCTTPYSCPYQGICFPDDSAMDNSIFTLPRLSLAKKKELWDSGIREITDLAKDAEITKVKQQKVPPSALPYIQSCQRGEPLINKPEIKQFLKEAPFPRYYLDFETTSLPVVPWSVRPYQHIPFQVSLHTQKKHNEPAVHQGYLHMNLTNDPMSDPRTNIIQFLTKWIPPKITGSVVCYHASFERGVIEGLCQYLTNNTICDQSIVSHLQGINTHMFDLEKVFKSAYVDRRFRGSTSIKAVQPVLVPTKSYGDLEVVKNGAAATAVYRMWMGGHMSLEDVQKHVDALNVYCERDTEVMVLIMDYLHKIVEMK
eukprot:PhF_6_TR41290/c0_g1_i1/m.62481